ncbi:hypothetical protein INR49_006107 [Caranx melampygus]|nr:hypothetical protein INR49_006107 [Caranx melampygus]
MRARRWRLAVSRLVDWQLTGAWFHPEPVFTPGTEALGALEAQRGRRPASPHRHLVLVSVFVDDGGYPSRLTAGCHNVITLATDWTLALFWTAVPELGEKNRENKAREKKEDGEKRTEVVVEMRRREGMNESEREEANVHITLRVSPVVAHRTSVGKRLCATA